MFVMETRLNRVKAGLGRPVDEITDRSPWDWYAQSCPCGTTRRVPHASPSPQQPAAAGGRLAGLGVRGGARRRQDARRRVLGPAPRRDRRDEGRLSDRADA